MTIAIVGVLVAITLPNMRVFIQNARVSSQTNELLADLNLARSEASKRGSAVVACPSSTSDTATPACDAGNLWERGWIIFGDTNGDQALSGGEQVVRAHSALVGGNTLRHNQAGMNTLSYSPGGTVSPAPGAGTRIIFSVCDERGASNARGVTIETTGRAASVHNTATTPLTCP